MHPDEATRRVLLRRRRAAQLRRVDRALRQAAVDHRTDGVADRHIDGGVRHASPVLRAARRVLAEGIPVGQGAGFEGLT